MALQPFWAPKLAMSIVVANRNYSSVSSAFIELAMVENPGLAIGILTLAVIFPET